MACQLCKLGIIGILTFTLGSCSILKTYKPPENGLAAYYPFNKNADDATGKHNGIVSGATLTSDRFNEPESAYFFDGNDAIVIPDAHAFNNMESFCISVWVYPTEISNIKHSIISKVNPNRDFNLKIFRGRMCYIAHFAHGSTYYRCYSKAQVELHTWTHLLFQWTGTSSQIYINGVLNSEVDFEGFSPPWTGNVMAIGSMNGGEFFNGKIDDVRIYSRTLSQNEITLLFQEK